MEQASCIEDKMDNCSSMAFAVADMKEMTRAFCTEHTSGINTVVQNISERGVDRDVLWNSHSSIY
jgi:hypothetical protein